MATLPKMQYNGVRVQTLKVNGVETFDVNYTKNGSTVKAYHKHQGVPGLVSANGCYTKESTKQVTEKCNVTRRVVNTSSWECGNCGGTVNHTHWQYSHSLCGATADWKHNVCSSCGADTSEGSAPSTGTHDYKHDITVYELGCGYDAE